MLPWKHLLDKLILGFCIFVPLSHIFWQMCILARYILPRCLIISHESE